jgi:hypothetical protein
MSKAVRTQPTKEVSVGFEPTDTFTRFTTNRHFSNDYFLIK